ncbi:MAG: Bax inhibitor-1/YccA family protein [Desulfarculus sp.]|jgi:FtsH-binding integral membrane protein|nr:MAG: Bax inhibitor-1/YccA family protein [Desulfarculus sp.]
MEKTLNPIPPRSITLGESELARVNVFMRRVYNWMAGGLALTALVAWWAQGTPAVVEALFNPTTGPTGLFWILALAELGLVFGLSGLVQRMSAGTAGLLFAVYSALNGLTISFIFMIYTTGSLVSTFLVCAGTFAVASVWAYSTKRDLTRWGSFLFMGLIGIIIASLVNFFLKSPMLYWIVSYLGVGIFVGLTAYDTQQLKLMVLTNDMGEEVAAKASIIGALKLYLDFINLFLMLLRIMGDRR